MERLLVVVFDNEKKAYEGSHALIELDREGSIAIHGETIIQKNADGTIDIKKLEDEFPLRTLTGTAIGSLIGLFGGPVGVAVGAGAGATAGLIGDAYVAGVNTDFVAEVSARLTAGKFALIADINEEWVTPVDTTMEVLGGVVFRSAKAYVEAEQRARDITEIKADIAQLKAEHIQARAERKAKIQAKIDSLKAKLHTKVEQVKQRAKEIKNEADAKVHALQQKAANSRQEKKAAIGAQIAEIQREFEVVAVELTKATALAEVELRKTTAEELRKAAAELEKAG
jgi:uncharacterized membrane protein